MKIPGIDSKTYLICISGLVMVAAGSGLKLWPVLLLGAGVASVARYADMKLAGSDKVKSAKPE